MQTNFVGWFEIYVQDLQRATNFNQTVLDMKLSLLETPASEVRMMTFPQGGTLQ